MIAGLYTIELYDVISEEWISHTIDEMIPCKKASDGSYRSVVADPNGEEIWVPLLEKAMAKHFGGYSGIGEGSQLSLFVYVLVCMYASECTGSCCTVRFHIPQDQDELVWRNSGKPSSSRTEPLLPLQLSASQGAA